MLRQADNECRRFHFNLEQAKRISSVIAVSVRDPNKNPMLLFHSRESGNRAQGGDR